MWFRQDLRLADNAALWHATQKPCIALVILSPAQWQKHDDAPIKINFYLRQLQQLKKELHAKNIPLIIKNIPLWQDIPTYIKQLCNELHINHIFANAELAVHEQQRDQHVLDAFKNQFNIFQDRTLFPTKSVRNKSGEPYKVFTPFKKNCYERLNISIPTCYPTPEKQQNINVPNHLLTDDLDIVLKQYPISEMQEQMWCVGEKHAHERLNIFIQDDVKDYHKERDLPSQQGTSQLSAYLNIGVLSPRQCLNALFRPYHGQFHFNSDGEQTWLDELLWREFYQHILFDFPRVSKHLPFKPETQKLQWRNSTKDFQAWAEGKTGIPIVDAGMRELLSTGWMHNRVRMICAMFLSKNLLVDWRKGEQFFMQHLVDGDLAANNGGWQWSASTGTDSVPYFRVFNAVTQSQRFDPNGNYIKRWIPELKQLDEKSIHDPYAKIERIGLDYPKPICDLKGTRKRAIEAFKALA